MVYVDFAEGKGGETIPAYEDDEIAFSAAEHIHAAGGWPTANLARADLVLAVNTPFDGVTVEASNPKNTGTITEHTEKFVADVKRYLKQGKAVAVADIAYGNGADNALVRKACCLRWLEYCWKYFGICFGARITVKKYGYG